MNTMNTLFQPSPGLLRRNLPKRHLLSLLAILILACCSLLLHPGCVAIPIPQGYRNLEREGKRIGEARLSFVVPGETTKAEFIERIGEPYLVLDEYGVMAYYWKMIAAYVPWVIGVPGGGAAGILEVDRQHVLLVSYDDRGIIDRYETIKNFQGAGLSKAKPVDELARQWAAKMNIDGLARQWAAKMHCVRNSTATSSPVGKSVVYVFHHADPLGTGRSPNSVDGVFLDDNLWAELTPGQYAAIPVSPGPHTIGFERDIRTTDTFIHPERQKPQPFLTESINVRPDQNYFLEVYFVERDSRDFKKTPTFSELSEEVALPKLAGLKRVR
jgi:hypothetical protein